MIIVGALPTKTYKNHWFLDSNSKYMYLYFDCDDNRIAIWIIRQARYNFNWSYNYGDRCISKYENVGIFQLLLCISRFSLLTIFYLSFFTLSDTGSLLLFTTKKKTSFYFIFFTYFRFISIILQPNKTWLHMQVISIYDYFLHLYVSKFEFRIFESINRSKMSLKSPSLNTMVVLPPQKRVMSKFFFLLSSVLV